MAYITIPPGDVDQGSIIDEALMSGKIKNNFDDHETRILALEAGGGTGGGGGAAADQIFADVIAGGQDNCAKFWKRRYHIFENTLDNQTNDYRGDFEQKDLGDRFIFDPSFGNIGVAVFNGQAYKSYFRRVENGEKVQFRIKKGENFFCIGEIPATGPNSTNWSVLVDGVNANTYGLVDQNDVLVASSFNSNFGNKWGLTKHFYGLDGEEHVITIVNNDTGELTPYFIDVGYRSEEYAIDHTVKINAGRANVGGTEVNFNGGLHTFSKPGEGLSQGYTGMLKIDQTGTITAVDGLSPAKTEVKPRETLAFTGAVTTIPVKNHFQFPTFGICMLQNPHGDSYLFSYSSKGQTGGPQTQSLDGVIWQSQPDEDITYLPDHNPAGGIGEFYGDGRIEYWAKPPILIDGTNNKIDFQITVNGVQTLHAATIASGYYSADLLPIEKAINDAMQAVKAINGRYIAKYDSEARLWTIGVEDGEVSEINFLWNSGANSGSSLGPTLGQTNDQTGATSYLLSTQVQHLAQRVFVEDTENRSALHSSIKKSWVRSSDTEETHMNEIAEKTRLDYLNQNTSGSKMIQIYPDDDCMGMTLYFPQEDENTYFCYSVDDSDYIYLGRPSRQGDLNIPTFTTVHSFFISLPKNSSKVEIVRMFGNEHEIDNITPKFTFLGYRQHFTKPPWEGLAENERVLKTFEIAPIRLFDTRYGNHLALYTPQPSDDNLNNITEVGTWNQEATTSIWNRSRRWTSGLDAYVEFEFVLQGDGGGIALGDFIGSTAYSREVEVYISDTAINETTDLIEMYGQAYSEAVLYGTELFRHLGLKAGTYFCRIKNKDSGLQLTNNYVSIIDTVPPQPNAPTITDINNTNQSIAFPVYCRRRNTGRYSQPNLLTFGIPDGGVRNGMVHHADYLIPTHTTIGENFDTNLYIYRDQYWSAMAATNAGDYFRYQTFCRSLSVLANFFSSYDTAVQPSIDTRNLNTVSLRVQAKNGSVPSTTRTDSARAVFFDMEFPCTFNAGLTYNIADTRGIRDGQKAILVDNTGATEEVFIENLVTDVSFDIKVALSVLTPANVVKIQFHGFHSMEMGASGAGTYYNSAFYFEPLPIEESILRDRLAPVWKEYSEVDKESLSTGSISPSSSVTLTYSLMFFDNGEAETQWDLDQLTIYSLSNSAVRQNNLSGFGSRIGILNPQASFQSATVAVFKKFRKIVNDNWPRIMRG